MSFSSFPPRARRRVVVTGMGAVTPLGSTLPITWERLLRGDRAGRPLKDVPFYFPAPGTAAMRSPAFQQRILDSIPCGVACPVLDDAEISGANAKGPKGGAFSPTPREPRAHKFCHAAADEALVDAGLSVRSACSETSTGLSNADDVGEVASPRHQPMGVAAERVGVNIGMGIPSLADVAETTVHLYAGGSAEAPTVAYSRVHPYFVPKILGNMAAAAIAMKHGFHGPIGSSVGACATGAQCLAEAANWIADGEADVAVAGATESCINPISMAGFARMKALAVNGNDDPPGASRPFDRSRGGFVMGEGAGVFVLESLESALRRGAPKIYAELRGFGCRTDAFHVSSPHPKGLGAIGCIHAALANSSGVTMQDVAYVNAHATGTPMGDEIELAAISTLCGGQRRPLVVSSSKGALGHLLGAAGAVEAAVAVLSLYHRVAPPTVNLNDPLPTESGMVVLNRVAHELPKDTRAVLSTSFGFGGVNTALIFSSAPL